MSTGITENSEQARLVSEAGNNSLDGRLALEAGRQAVGDKTTRGRVSFCPQPFGAEIQSAGARPLDTGSVRRLDPRDFQITALLTLLSYGWRELNLEVPLSRAMVILGTALLAQLLCGRFISRKRIRFEPRSALISGLSLCLLLRTNSLLLAAAAAAAAIFSKFLLRCNGKHVFNPTNFALVLMLLCAGGSVWVSPGQWGNLAFFAFAVICLGGLVVNRAARADITLVFLAFYLALLFGRSLRLGEPMSIPWHRVQNGALLIFAFFMISDPKTTPNSRMGRFLFALLVALGAAYVQFKLFRTNGLLWSLAACSLFVPIIDRMLPGRRYQWRTPVVASLENTRSETEAAMRATPNTLRRPAELWRLMARSVWSAWSLLPLWTTRRKQEPQQAARTPYSAATAAPLDDSGKTASRTPSTSSALRGLVVWFAQNWSSAFRPSLRWFPKKQFNHERKCL